MDSPRSAETLDGFEPATTTTTTDRPSLDVSSLSLSPVPTGVPTRELLLHDALATNSNTAAADEATVHTDDAVSSLLSNANAKQPSNGHHVRFRQHAHALVGTQRARYILVALVAAVAAFALGALIFSGSADGGGGGSSACAHADTQNDTLVLWAQIADAYAHAANTAVDPCSDFYEHVCGNFVREHDPLPAGVDRWDEFAELNALVTYELRSIAEAGWPLVGTWYDACLNSDAREARALDALEPLLESVRSVQDARSLAAALGTLHAAGVDAAGFALYVDTDERNTSRNVLYVSFGGTSVPQDVFASNDTFAHALLAARRRYAFALLSDASFSADAALSVEALLANAMPAAVAQRDPTHAEMRMHDMCAFEWDAYFAVFGLDHEPLLLANGALDALCAATSDVSMSDWRAYLAYALLHSYAYDLPLAYSAARVQFDAALQGVDAPATPQNASWVDCVQSTSAYLGNQLAHYYTERFFPSTSKQLALDMVHTLLATLGARLSANTWMDSATKLAAQRKLAAIVPLIGYPEHWQSDVVFAVHTDTHLQNVVGARRDSFAQMLLARDAPSQRYRWLMDAFQVNAYYQPTDNDVAFPAAILQGLFFVPGAPLAVNYGGFGSVISHELTHAFDDQGRHYDADGARRDWWSAASAAAFDERAQCLVELYDTYEAAPGVRVDGVLTLGENLADSGVVVALQAMRSAQRQLYAYASVERQVQQAFGMSSDRLFFHAYAYNWCSVRTPQLAYELAHTDVHSPPRWRIIGSLSQSREFAAAYGCAIPSPMAPTDVCVVW